MDLTDPLTWPKATPKYAANEAARSLKVVRGSRDRIPPPLQKLRPARIVGCELRSGGVDTLGNAVADLLVDVAPILNGTL